MDKLFAAIIALVIMPLALAGQPQTYANRDGAIRGYDPVAYFTLGDPTRGDKTYTTRWQGAIYKFASAENLALFKSDPERYSPQYGGYCAYAVAKGSIAQIDPEAWTIVNGKLYLNFSPAIRKRWNQDIPGNIRAANKNWPGVLN